MKTLKSIITVFLVALTIFSVTPLIEATVPVAPIVSVAEAKSKVKLNKTKLTMVQYDEIKLKVKGTKRTVKWSSNNKKVARVTKKGKVIAKKPGKAVITAKVGSKKYKCKVTVKKWYSENGMWKAEINGDTWYFDINDYTSEHDSAFGMVYVYKNDNSVDNYIAAGEYYKIGINKYEMICDGCMIDFKVSANKVTLTQKNGSVDGTELNGPFTLVSRHYA
jgi:hypothetical protein